jgi:uncharacterized protein YgiM (DUF1202 family)
VIVRAICSSLGVRLKYTTTERIIIDRAYRSFEDWLIRRQETFAPPSFPPVSDSDPDSGLDPGSGSGSEPGSTIPIGVGPVLVAVALIDLAIKSDPEKTSQTIGTIENKASYTISEVFLDKDSNMMGRLGNGKGWILLDGQDVKLSNYVFDNKIDHFLPYMVQVAVESLNIMSGPGIDNNTVVGSIKDKGSYTIIEESDGVGARKWGKLKSGEGWISLNDTVTLFLPYMVKIAANSLNIRIGPGTNYAISGSIDDKGSYTIVDEAKGDGASRWGKLKSGAGWISLDFIDFLPYTVKVTAKELHIRCGPGTNYSIGGTIKDKGSYTIVREATGEGASLWGKLKDSDCWIALDYTSFLPYTVKVTTDSLNIRSGPGTNNEVIGLIKDCGCGAYTIVKEASGVGASRWGKLKDHDGWISLDYASR